MIEFKTPCEQAVILLWFSKLLCHKFCLSPKLHSHPSVERDKNKDYFPTEIKSCIVVIHIGSSFLKPSCKLVAGCYISIHLHAQLGNTQFTLLKMAVTQRHYTRSCSAASPSLQSFSSCYSCLWLQTVSHYDNLKARIRTAS